MQFNTHNVCPIWVPPISFIATLKGAWNIGGLPAYLSLSPVLLADDLKASCAAYNSFDDFKIHRCNHG